MAKSIYTDLAMEARELMPQLSGVSEEKEKLEGVSVSRIAVESDEAAQRLSKLKGNYITLDAPELADRPLDLFEGVSRALARELERLMGELPEQATVLVVGLGNRAITPDALGPRTVEQVFVTRHVKQYVPDAIEGPIRSVCAVEPGVLGTTGIESMEVVRGVVEHTKPDLIIVIDALASRRAARISTTLQVTDTGISPGSGVGNQRAGLNYETFQVPVIALGVPTVVYASTIFEDTISLIVNETGMQDEKPRMLQVADKVINEHMGPLVVTPKDIDSIVKDMSRILADGINMALFGQSYDQVRALIA